MADIYFWGVRGSHPSSGKNFIKFGGNTSCISIEHQGDHYIFDAGTGIINLGQKFKSINKAHLFLSHGHYDHVIGMPFFSLIWNSSFTLDIYAGVLGKYGGTKKFFKNYLFGHPFFPVQISQILAKLNYHDLTPNEVIMIDGVKIETIDLDHPGGAIGYALYIDQKKFCHILDTETTKDSFIEKLTKFINKADVCIYDSTFTDDEKDSHKGWGHSSWEDAVKIAKKANVKNLYFVHHAPFRSDNELLKIEKEAQKIFKNAFVAYEGMKISL